MTLALISWAVIPFSATQVLADINVGILYLFAVSSLGVYGIIMGGWASNSKYPFLGAIRSAAQMVSYEVSIGVIIINVLLCVGSLNLNDIVIAQQDLWFVIPLFPMFVIFFISALAETNRPPFDLPEAEAELVAGYQTEYSGMMYAMFWLGEYANILLMCAMGAILFLGGWLSPIDIYPFTLVPGAIWLILKILLLFILFALVKVNNTAVYSSPSTSQNCGNGNISIGNFTALSYNSNGTATLTKSTGGTVNLGDTCTWNRSSNIDLKPYLVQGNNTITITLVVIGGGGMHYSIDYKMKTP